MIKRTFVLILIPVLLLFAALVSCNKEHSETPSNGKIIGASECKNYKSTMSDTIYGCAEYSFNSASGILLIEHINAIFNCCPGDISCNVSIVNDTITIVETASEASCHCACFYDLDIEVTGVGEKEYYIRIVEPHIGLQTQLEFIVNLNAQTNGTKCEERDPYI